MGFQGLKYRTANKGATRSLNGFYGVKVRFDVVSVRITDYRGKGLQNVTVHALNPTSGIPFTGYTDRSGSVFMDLDDDTDIILTKDLISKTVHYNSSVDSTSPIYTIDLPMIQNN